MSIFNTTTLADVRIIRPQAGFQEKFVRSNVDFVVGGGSMGGGKENPTYTPILTPNGWVKMGELSIGDFVNTPFGSPARVLEIYEHKNKDIYEVETFDGRKSHCGIEHLWSFRTKKQLQKYRNHRDFSKNLTTEDTSSIISRMENGQEIYLPIPKPQKFGEKDFVIPPYVLGVLIGDGCISRGMTSGSFIISNTEDDIVEKVKLISNSNLVSVGVGNFNKRFFSKECKAYSKYIKKIGLDTYSYNKFIPTEYLWGSIEQRRELLHGLMDTDGCVEDKNRYNFTTTSKKLSEDFVYLCRSLGYIATVSIDNRNNKYTSGCAYKISIHTDDIIFSSKKHIERYNKNIEKSERKYARTNDHVRIKSIKKIGVSDTRCIWIDDPMHLYIINDFIVTHNTAGAVLSVAEAVLDPRFRAVFLRNNLGDLKSGGGILDEFKNLYGQACNVVESGDPHVDFDSGARIDVTHIADQSKEKVLQRFKGRQYDLIYFDEGTGFTWDCFTAVYSRNRGTAKWTGKVRMTTNPKRSHWLRKFLDWYIGPDGFIMPERNGIVRYFYINGETVDDVVWGDTKEEVYNQCKIQIDRTLKKFNGANGTSTYKDMIKSFTFYLGTMSENKAVLGNNSGYVGSVAVMGGREAQANLEGNWNVDVDEDLNATIPSTDANMVFINEPRINGDKWVTADLADVGNDNFVALAWNGFHVIDALILCKTVPKQNAERLEAFAAKHDISNSHIIYDATRALYINDYIPDAIPFISGRKPMGLYSRMAVRLKDECFLRLVEMIKRGDLTIDESVARRIYEHQKLKDNITIQNEFLEECSVVRFKEATNGKMTLLSKHEMNARLGKSRSMDFVDPCAMRMLPVLEYPYGEELVRSIPLHQDVYDDDEYFIRESIFDENTWR